MLSLSEMSTSEKAILEVLETVRRLRAPGGCPWDRKQTFQSLRPYFLEETHEALEALDRIDMPERLKDPSVKNPFIEELGDVLLQILLHSEIANETGDFNFSEVCRFLNEKLIRRHPHVFGDASADSAESAYLNWERIKAQEKGAKTSVLDGLPAALPALSKTARVIDKVTRVGFQWPDLTGPLAKLDEEVRELREVAEHFENNKDDACLKQKLESELGDVLFCVANLGHLLKVNPEDALRSTTERFEKRFRYVEKRVVEQGKKLEDTPLVEMDRYWDEAKLLEKIKVIGLTGGIASGKSTASGYFRGFGIPVIDADAIAKELTSPGSQGEKIYLSLFGTSDKKTVKDKILESPELKQKLEAALHPLIQKRSREEILKFASQGQKVVIYDAALLIEANRHKELQGVIVITCPLENRIDRLVARDKTNRAHATKMIDAQISDTEKLKHSTWVIENDSSLEALKVKVQSLAEIFTKH